MAVRLPVFVHGITPNAPWVDHRAEFMAFKDHVATSGNKFEPAVELIWGQERARDVGPRDAYPHEFLRRCEEQVSKRVGYSAVSAHAGDPGNVLIHDGLEGTLLPLMGYRKLREEVVLMGLADAAYYASPDGEAAVRRALYENFLDKLFLYDDEDEIRIHMVAHSLGVTVAFDLLYGLFCRDHDYYPGFKSDRDIPPELKRRFDYWCGQAGRRLKIASITFMASQLPIFFLRNEPLLKSLAGGGSVNGQVLGIKPTSPHMWNFFYDVKDPLGFPTRPLFGNPGYIHEIQVDNGGTDPAHWHTGYWTNPTVLARTKQLIAATW